ncbi:MAG TPA: secretin and TonB N-terminal domain-containing protein, partial [Phycisphaerae bacterium]|nr:secretin and TonB N-terminal domain-containing protein [Phycisphaerae bacterium]
MTTFAVSAQPPLIAQSPAELIHMAREGRQSETAGAQPAESENAAEPAAPDASSEAAPQVAEPGEGAARKGKDQEQYIRVGVDNRVTMHVADLPLAEAVRMIGEPLQRNIILAKDVSGTVTATLYDVTFEAALEAMLLSNGLGYRSEGNFIF